mgnify:CR=1 FL=1
MAVNPAAVLRVARVVLGTGLAYVVLFLVNEHLLAFTHFSQGVNWVYLPSGLRLTLVLLFGWPAALGIAWSSALVSMWPTGLERWAQPLVTGLISGFTPWLMLLASSRWLNLQDDLAGLRASSLLVLALLFALSSAGVHQLWFEWNETSQDRGLQFVVMAAGDLAGSLIVLYACKWGLKAITHPS